MARRAEHSPKRLAAIEHEAKATELYIAGANYDEIARSVGYHDRSGARKAIERVRRRWQEESRTAYDTDAVRQLKRYDRMLLGIWGRATNGDCEAISAACKIMAGINQVKGYVLQSTTITNNTQVNVADNVRASRFHIPESDEELALLADLLRGVARLTGGASEEGPGLPG